MTPPSGADLLSALRVLWTTLYHCTALAGSVICSLPYAEVLGWGVEGQQGPTCDVTHLLLVPGTWSRH